MQWLKRKSLRSSSGQAMIEFALALPLLLAVVFAAIDFGRAYSVYVTLNNAVREGARYGSANPTDGTGMTSTVKNAAGPYNDSNLTVTTTSESQSNVPYQSSPTSGIPTCESGEYVTVAVQYNLSLITPLSAFVKLVTATTNITTSWTLAPTAEMCAA